MKRTFNMTTSRDDYIRYADETSLADMLDAYGFDGVELMCFDEGAHSFIPKGRVTGLHMNCYTSWVDLWNEDEEALLAEYGTLENVEKVFGGTSRQALIDHHCKDLENAHKWGAEYVVFHASDALVRETFSFKSGHTSEQVAQAAQGLMDAVFSAWAEKNPQAAGPSIALLYENLWFSGLNFLEPDMTRQLVEGTRYPNTGIMLDTGHLLHTDFDLCTQDQGVDYVLRQIEAHEHAGALGYVRGAHLNQSLTGEYCKGVLENPPCLPEDYWERSKALFLNAFKVDRHEPWSTPRVREIVDRLALEWCTFEFITGSKEQLEEYLRVQKHALGWE